MAEIQITRNLKEINDELKTTNSQLKATAKSVSSLEKALKVDPANAKLLKSYYDALNTEIDSCRKKVELLKEKQAKLVEANGPEAKLTPQYKALEAEIAKAESTANKLNEKLNRTAKIDLSALKSGLKNIATVAAGIVTAVMAIGVAFAKTSDEIDKYTKKYGGTAEQWQYAANAWDQLTGDASAYATVLNSVLTVQAQVQKESSKTGTVLAQLGLTFDDLKGKTSTEALQIYTDALSKIDDDATRTAIAVALFGSTAGVYIANMCSTGSEAISEWNDELTKAGILTNEEVAKGAALQDTFDYLKKTLISLVATLGNSLKPTIQTLIGLFKSFVPIVNALSAAITALGPAGTIAMGVFISLITFLPTLIMMMNALNVSTGNMVLAALGYAALAAATGITIGYASQLGGSYSSSSDYENRTVSGAGAISEGDELGSSGASSGGSTTTGTATTTNKTVTDNSTNNYYISNEVDADEVIEKISDRRRALMGG